MTDHIRVKDKTTGHEYTIPAHLFNEAAHEKSNKSALGHDGEPAAIKFRTTVNKAAAQKKPASPAASTGHQADQKES